MIPDIYVVTLKGSEFSIQDAVVYLNVFINKGWIEAPRGKFEMRSDCDPSLIINGVDGRYMHSLGQLLVREFPQLRTHITITPKGMSSEELDLHIVGQEFDIGYVRIARIVPMA